MTRYKLRLTKSTTNLLNIQSLNLQSRQDPSLWQNKFIASKVASEKSDPIYVFDTTVKSVFNKTLQK